MGQPIRPSQFVLTYGVGSIIETPRGPRVIPIFEKWDLFQKIFSGSGSTITRFQIVDRNAKAQLGGGEIFEIPTNPQFDLPTTQPLFRTARFPRWALCRRHWVLYRLGLHGKSNCPICNRIGDAQDEAIRFVRACPNGHLDDIDWRGIVHGGKVCPGETFDWVTETGSDLKSVRARCRTCGAEVSLLDIYYRTSTCSGYVPEEGRREPCDEEASVVLRSAASLRIAEVVTSITIPPPALRIHTLLSQPVVGRGLLLLAASSNNPKENLLENLSNIASSRPDEIDPTTVEEIEKITADEVEQAIKDLLTPTDNSKSVDQVKQEEFAALKRYSKIGYPPRPSTGHLFEVDHTAVTRMAHPSGITFRVTPVKRMRVVLVQKGYRRPIRGFTYPNGRSIRLVETFYLRGGKRWYPGVALQGEGIFIDLPEGNPYLDEERARLWLKRKQQISKTGRREAYLFDPLFIWWHTLSHRLIKGLSLDSGYSSAAIRERVYFSEATSTQKKSGGILLYTAQQGSDGSLGGLIALCGQSEFSRAMAAAERNINACSNDPLCSEHLGHDNGAACYACLLVSETSCEFHNTHLDRLLLARSLTGLKT